ncbi:hypothetical protein ANOM_002928 [Aspergillus nomiae NRRL 13137]|uniref:FAD dependent oxidoreductase domain-containing protein n=1 Tax=Aspergillus nomiae NRRL (strain ATCC 15546 / NRRL 13137 / CBS 260.88 / M93) TaxID=1509407 RepID=A0A0L1JBC5_ASPN3|nr:uncharacterized protein ANOM_002928 [Aspergillus nomiae NRRL 13137]KNG89054.1 hypothetical protein ANOM_002928 [Aspergillus nomiae NRRL 13137]
MENRTPSKTDTILIIGAGVFGLSTALELSTRGYKNVTVLDRYPPPVPDGSSVDISRIIRSEYADPVYSRMAQEALKGWKSEYRDYYHHTGFVMLSETASNPYIEKTLEIIHDQGRSLKEFVNGNGLKEMYPDLHADLSSLRAYHNPEGGWADAEGSIRHLSHRCSQAGVSFVTGPRGTVLSLRRQGSRVVGVNVAIGDFIPANKVILSTGAWSNLLLDVAHTASASGQPVGFIQLSPEEARSIAKTPVMINLSSGIFCFPPTPGTNVLKVARHSYGFATSIRSDATNRAVSSPKLDSNNANKSFLPQEADNALRHGLRQLIPRFADRPWSNRRLCWYTDTPEGDFVVDYHPQIDGLFVAIGGAGHGFKFLPVLGRYIADRYENCAPEILQQKWRLRLPDGSGDLKIGDGSRGGPPLRMLTVEEQSKFTFEASESHQSNIISSTQRCRLMTTDRPNVPAKPVIHAVVKSHDAQARDQSAISLRFEREVEIGEARILQYAKDARSLVMDRINNGDLELSALQTLCLLATFEFSVGHTIQAGLTLNMAAYLAQSVSITGEILANIQTDADEKRRCSWSIYMLRHLQGDGIQTSRLISGVHTPFNTGSGLSPKYTPPSIREPRGSNTKEDLGLVSYTIQLSEVWALAMNYAATKVDPVSLPPWFPESDYSVVSFRHTEFDSLVPLKYRYHAENLQNHSLQELNQRRDFWGPWLFVQIMFETIPCLLNHPFLLSMRLRSFRHTMPHSFIRQSFENITLHASWILHLIDLVEHKGFEICDPILAHCVVIVATIHLQHSFVDDQGLRDTARNGYNKCVRFLQPLGERWPHVRNMMQKLHRLREGVSASTNSQSWSNNAKLLWELLVYDRASSSQSSNDFFGTTLSDPNAKHTDSRFMTPDPDFPLVGSAGISGHKTVAKEVVAYPPESVSTPPASFTSRPDMQQAPSAEPFGLIDTPAEGMLNDNLFLAPESYGRAIEDWWNFTSS